MEGSLIICLHVSRVSARIEVNRLRTTDYGQQTTGNGPIRMVVCWLLFYQRDYTEIIQIFMLRKENREICGICWQEKK